LLQTGVILVLIVQPGARPSTTPTPMAAPLLLEQQPQPLSRHMRLPSAATAYPPPPRRRGGPSSSLPPPQALQQQQQKPPPERRADTLDAMLDLVRNMFPENVLQSALQHQQTTYSSSSAAAGHGTNNNNGSRGANSSTWWSTRTA
jgi:hypothetical protein